jgi:hypothetical protein
MRAHLSPVQIPLAIAMQLVLAVAPSSALVLCVSADGCTALEISLPGIARCVERDCDDGHRQTGADEHACRDFPVLSAAPAKAQSAVGTIAPPGLAYGAPPMSRGVSHDRLVARRDHAATPTAAARSLRTTILLL